MSHQSKLWRGRQDEDTTERQINEGHIGEEEQL